MFVRWKRDRLRRAGTRWSESGEIGCFHPHGVDSVRRSPQVVESYRVPGGPSKHHRVWVPGISIRECCINDRQTTRRVRFWLEIMHAWRRDITRTHIRFDDLVENKGEIFEDIARVVPFPEPWEFELAKAVYPILEQYFARPIDLESEHAFYHNALRCRMDWNAHRITGESFEDYYLRSQKTRRRQSHQHRAQNDCSDGSQDAECWMILGISWPCTYEEVQAAYRPLARIFHTDRGGDHNQMVALNNARDEALRLIEFASARRN